MASIIKKADKKALSTGVGKKVMKGKGTYKKFLDDLDLVIMRGKNMDAVQYIHELSDQDNVYASYLLLTYGDYARADPRDFRMSGNREVMDLWRRISRTMDRNAAEDRLREIHSQI